MVVMQRDLDRSVQLVLQRLHLWMGALVLLVSLLFLATSWRLQAGLQTVFDDRVVPLHDLQRISELLNVTLPDALTVPPAQADALRQPLAELDALWRKYQQTYLTAEEQRLMRSADAGLQRLLASEPAARPAAHARELAGLNASLGALLRLQVDVAKQELQAARRGAWLGMGCALLCLLALWRLRLHVRQTLSARVIAPLRTVADAVAELAAGKPGLSQEARMLSGDFAEVGEQLRRLDVQLQERSALQQRTEALLAQLKGTQEELVESAKLASLGALVAGVSHELNTPLGVAVTVGSSLNAKARSFRAEMGAGPLRRSALEGFLEAVDEGLELLQRNVERAAALIRSFKQVAVDRSGLQRRRFDLARTVTELLDSLRPVYGRDGVELCSALPEGVMLDSYPGELGQVISNLVVNAVVHGFEGGSGRFSLRLGGRDAQGVTLIVEDDGRGMTSEERARAFDPFFTTKLGQGGSGLGLPIVRNLVLGVLGGRLRLDSEPGRGTRFEIQLPLQAPLRADA